MVRFEQAERTLLKYMLWLTPFTSPDRAVKFLSNNDTSD